MSKRRFIRVLLALAVIAVAAAFLIPRFPAEGFRGRVEAAMENVLLRDVSIGDLRFTIWGGPGFTLRNVVVADRPEISAEPFAYVNEARIALALSSLWEQELVLGSITLIQPSVNIAESPGGEGNYDQLLRRGVGQQARSGQPLPRINVEGARINVRRGLRKSEYYFRNADFRLEEEGRGTDAWLLEFRAEPARTDSVAPRFGTVRGRGRWRATAGPNGEVDLDVEIERSPLAELAALFQLSRVGLNGFVTARAHLSGPANQAELQGHLELSEQPGWSFLPLAGSGQAVRIEGLADLPGRRLLLRSATPEDASPPYVASLAVNPVDAPGAWRASVDFRDLPMYQALDLMRYASDATPEYLRLDGTLAGNLSFQSDKGLTGTVQAPLLLWEEGEFPPFALRDLQVAVDGEQLRGESTLDLQAHPIAADQKSKPSTGPTFRFALDGATGRVAVTLAGVGIRSAHFDALRRLTPMASSQPPLLAGKQWRASGVATWQRPNYRDAGAWVGAIQVRDAELTLPDLSSPVLVESATLDLRPRSWHARAIAGTVGDIPFRGSLRHSPGATRPDTLELRFDELALEDLIRHVQLAPPDQRNFFRRALSSAVGTTPLRVTGRVLQAKIYIDTVLIRDSKYQQMQADLYMDRNWLEIRNIRMKSRFGPMSAYLEADLAGSTPQWRWKAMGGGGAWQGGTLRLESTRRASGDLEGIQETIGGEETVTWVRGPGAAPALPSLVRARLRWEPGRNAPVICADCLEVRMNRAVWLGSCNQSNSTGYVCRLEDPRTGEQTEIDLAGTLVGLAQK